MRVLMVYNQYRSLASGEENVIQSLVRLMRERGIEVRLFMRSSRGLEKSLAKKAQAFWKGIYSREAYRQMLKLLKVEHPNIVHVHNLYPLLSPSVLIACRDEGIPVVMTIHNSALTCPNWYHIRDGQLCEKCVGGHEYWCVFKNCRKNLFESIGYGLRAAIARKCRFFHDNVTVFIAISEFVKRRLIDAGFDAGRIVVSGNMISVPDSAVDPTKGEYVAYAGRISPEKGIDVLIAATEKIGIPLRLAGEPSNICSFKNKMSGKVEFVGLLDTKQLDAFYRKARFVVVPSIWFEPFCLVAAEAMAYGLPVVASRIGGLPEVVEEGVTGFLFEPGNGRELADKMRVLWHSPDILRKVGKAGREKAIKAYSEDIYWNQLMAAYEKAIKMN